MPEPLRLPTREALPAARARARKIAARLRQRYPQARVPLRHENAFQLLVATILSAQCTDARVNQVTPLLFQRYRTPADFAAADPRELEALIRPTGFFRQKAKAIMAASRTLVERFGGEMPRTMEDLLQLEGVGRKTANVVLGGYYGVPGVVVDTHVRRLSQRLALTGSDDPDVIEQDLMRLVPREEWTAFSLRLIFLGREICTARNPRCPACPLNPLCPSATYRGAPPWMSQPGPRRAAQRASAQGARRGGRVSAARARRG
ncbi:MAG: endonuclease III [Armatimonadota bacterium]|nr:endonuclease III [Armatimonadota bacterium]MDR7469102.1 endonuclease III [Armatimonadota bacterium]